MLLWTFPVAEDLLKVRSNTVEKDTARGDKRAGLQGGHKQGDLLSENKACNELR